jgi:CheY-like chemotaxis protein
MIERPLRIFILEDHQDTLKYLRLYLEQSGHAVQAARRVNEAVEALRAWNCDVLLSDIALSDGSGWDLLSQLGSARPPYAIAMSGFGSLGYVNRSKAAGYRHHLVKPIDPDHLDELLDEARHEKSVA